MAKARAIVKRRKAVRNIRKITKTMQMIATAKFQKALKRAVGTKPYTRKVRELVAELAGSVGGEVQHPLLRNPSEADRTNRIAVVVITSDRGLAGALDALNRTGANPTQIDIVKVPGSWEIPLVAGELARQKKHDAIICLSAVIRGETPHFDYVAAEAAKGIAQVSASTGVPVAFGVLTTNTLEQAIDRAGLKAGNKGYEAGLAAVEMASLRGKVAAETAGKR